MIEIKFDTANEGVLVQHIKDMFTASPTLIHNIVEPCVNGMISDQNIPAQIKESIKLGVQTALTPELIKANLESVIPEILADQGISNTIESIVTDRIESENGPIHDMVRDSIDSAVEDHVSPNDIEEAIDNKIDESINSRDIESTISDKIDEADIDAKVEIAIRDYIRSIDIERLVNTSISDNVENNLDPEAIKLATREVLASKFAVFTNEKVIELFKEFLATDPALKKLIEDQTTLPVMKKVTTPGMDTILIGIKPEATASFMWMIKGLMKDETIEIRQVNGK